MAIVKEYRYYTDEAHQKVNDYISDGHGDEVLLRDNRYLADGRHRQTEVRGYNCPADAVMAALQMDTWRAEYERYYGGAPGVRKGYRLLTQLQLVISWAEGEWVAPMDRHAMVERLISALTLRGALILAADHSNTRHGHMHISVCVYEPDGQHKVPTSMGWLNDLRREMDYICGQYGLSIVENSKLRRNKGYAEWFIGVKAQGEITIHPPRETKNTDYDHDEVPTEPSTTTKQVWDKPKHPEWESQTAGRYYYLPVWVELGAADVPREMYYPAMNMDHPVAGWGLLVRYAPLYLLLVAARERARMSEAALMLRRRDEEEYARISALRELQQLAEAGLQLIEKLDVGTMADIDRHIARAQWDIERRKKKNWNLNRKIRESRKKNPQKMKRNMERQAFNNRRIEDLQQECWQLEQLRALCQELRDPRTWAEYDDIIATYIPPTEKRVPRKPYIRGQLRNIGQLIGADETAMEVEMWSVLGRGKPAVIKRSATVIPEVTLGIAQAMADVARLCTSITDPYTERDKIDSVLRQLQQQIDGGALLRGMLALDTALLRYEEGSARARIAADVRSAAEDVQWHLRNGCMQLMTAQSTSTLFTAYGELALAMQEWDRFLHREMPLLKKHTKIGLEGVLLPPPCPDYTQALEEQVEYDFGEAIMEYTQQMKRARAKLDRGIAWHYGPDPVLEQSNARRDKVEEEPESPKRDTSCPEVEDEVLPRKPSLNDMLEQAEKRKGVSQGKPSRGRTIHSR